MRNILKKIQVKTLKTKITKPKWLSKLCHGHILANTYVRPIVFLSLQDSITFFPLKLPPKASTNSQPIYLVHANKNHCILAHVEGEDGIKPIPPPMVVPKSGLRNNKAWCNFLQKGRDLYNQESNA